MIHDLVKSFFLLVTVSWLVACLRLPEETVTTSPALPNTGTEMGLTADAAVPPPDIALPPTDMAVPPIDVAAPQQDTEPTPLLDLEPPTAPEDARVFDSTPAQDAARDATLDMEPPVPDAQAECVRSSEICDGRDNDCDGETDEASNALGKCKCEPNENAAYELCKRGVTWADARAACVARGGSLATIHSVEENQAVMALVQASAGGDRSPARRAWIGLHDQAREGVYVWVDDSAFQFAAWAEGEPNNHLEREHCIETMHEIQLAGIPTTGWNDLSCGTYHAFVCNRQ